MRCEVVCTMTAFDYYYQNSFRPDFTFLCAAIVIQTLLELSNSRTKG